MAMIQVSESRLFVAIPLPAKLKGQLGKWIDAKQQVWSFHKWVFEQDLHITLHFLGSTKKEQLNEITSAIQKLSREQMPFGLSLKGIGTFGQAEQPRILWAGIDGEIDKLQQLQKNITSVLSPIGFPAEKRPYRPHITLARKYKGGSFPTSIKNPWSEIDCEWMVEQIVLYETKLGERPMYYPLSVFPFKK